MADRRQGDRREGIQGKNVKISLPAFITVIVLLAAIVVSIVVCIFVGKARYDEGYKAGYSIGYDDAIDGKITFGTEDLDLNETVNEEEAQKEMNKIMENTTSDANN